MATFIIVTDLAAPASMGRGGLSMYVLQWARGLERLGHEVLFLEFLEPAVDELPPAAVHYFADTMARWWHPDRSALILQRPPRSLYGLDPDQVAQVARRAAAVITLAATYQVEPFPLIEQVRPRVLIEQDPAYTHFWADGGDSREIYGEQDIYYTVGGNIGTPRCRVPALGIEWRHIWNPVVLEWWPAHPLERDYFTTVADWRSYGYFEFEGQVLGPKAEEFRKFISLPERAGERVEIALSIDPADPDRTFLREHGWQIESPEVAADMAAYRRYVAGSLAEFSCVKGGYSGTRCGWFSDRSACYLASGRPVVLQATGFEDLLPTSEGLFAVVTVDEAVAAIQAIRRDYPRHAVAAREIAREFLDADRVLPRLLDEIGVGGAAARQGARG
jgi:hypothetical protein